MLSHLFDLFVPNECLLCERPLLSGEKGLCLTCQSKLPRTKCETPDNEAEHRMFGRIDYVHGTSFCYYSSGSDVARLITTAKYHGKPWINRHLAMLFASELSLYDWPYDIDVIVPVPIHFWRLVWRGYNQSQYIADAFSKAWHLPVDSHSLRKSVYTRSQVSRNGEARRKAVEGTFRLRYPERFANKHVLLVDDVLTTGATLEACAQLFTDAGARVSFLTLAMTK